jgi:hypothetical protein
MSELVKAYIADMEEDFPSTSDSTIPFMHQRQGFRKTVDMICAWEPTSVRALRERSRDGVIEEVDSE